ncbi:MAG: response regulator transcription factor [Christensenellales bacterium]|jgi:two-component system response regulator VicR
MPKTILVVDDEPSIIKGLRYSLEQDGYNVDEALDGEEALNKILSNSYDLVLLDVMLPALSGIEVCQRVREKSDVPIIMLTAKGDDIDKILGLEYGADDYMTKPFNILEVKARIKTILRRTSGKASGPGKEIITAGGITINVANRSATVDGRDVNLTAKEFNLIKLFMTNRGKVFTREMLLENIRKYNQMGDLRTVDVHIRRLREKIEKDPAKPEYILTKWGVGYYFSDK